MSAQLRLAIAKGRVLTEVERATALLPPSSEDRTLTRASNLCGVQCLVVKPWDVPLYVAAGVADLGIVGNDILRERNLDTVELVDLGLAACRLVLAGPEQNTASAQIRVATKYPALASELLTKQGIGFRLFELQGSVELAPVLGLTDAIVDIVQTGATLRDNGLTIWQELLGVSARLIANPAAWRLKPSEVLPVIKCLEERV